MKTILTIFLASGIWCSAQNVAVWMYGPNTNGVATNFPVSWKSIGVAVTYPSDTNAVVMSVNAALALKASTQASYDAYQASLKATAQAATDALNASNLLALSLSYSNLQWCADNWAYATNVANLRIAVQACGDTLLKLKPVLVEWYQKSQGGNQ